MLCTGSSHRLLRIAKRSQGSSVQSSARQLGTGGEHHVVTIGAYRVQRHLRTCVSMMFLVVTVLYGMNVFVWMICLWCLCNHVMLIYHFSLKSFMGHAREKVCSSEPHS